MNVWRHCLLLLAFPSLVPYTHTADCFLLYTWNSRSGQHAVCTKAAVEYTKSNWNSVIAWSTQLWSSCLFSLLALQWAQTLLSKSVRDLFEYVYKCNVENIYILAIVGSIHTSYVFCSDVCYCSEHPGCVCSCKRCQPTHWDKSAWEQVHVFGECFQCLQELFGPELFYCSPILWFQGCPYIRSQSVAVPQWQLRQSHACLC